ncbi:MAG: benzoate rane transport protein [Streptomyces sp.]|nr:benzoate rane transport protein [Streptomyces sp.]
MREDLGRPVWTGIVAAVVGFASSFAVVVAGLRAVGADHGEATSGLLTLCVAMGVLGIGLGLRYRQPISIVWSTPGAAMLVAAGRQPGGYRYAVGAFVVAGGLMLLTGLSGRLGRLIAAIPAPIAAAMLAGVLLQICLAPARAAVQLPALALPVIAAWLLLSRFARRWAIPGALVVALAGIAWRPGPQGADISGSLLPSLTFTMPAFSVGSLIGLGVPLYLVTMASQNLPGAAVLATYGYEAPMRPVLLSTGAATVLGAPFGGFSVNLAAITAALAAGPDAHPLPERRWIASVTAGGAYLVFGLCAGSATLLLAAAPPLLIEAVAGLALLGALSGALGAAMADPGRREAAMVAFAVSASGITVAGVSAPFWGLLAGLTTLAALTFVRKPQPA